MESKQLNIYMCSCGEFCDESVPEKDSIKKDETFEAFIERMKKQAFGKKTGVAVLKHWAEDGKLSCVNKAEQLVEGASYVLTLK